MTAASTLGSSGADDPGRPRRRAARYSLSRAPAPTSALEIEDSTRGIVRTLSLTESQLRVILAADRSLKAAQAVAETAADALGPQLARAVQATENAWRNIEVEFGMLTSKDVAGELGSRAKNPSEFTAAQRKNGKLLGVGRRNAILHPGFQFRDGEIRAAIPVLMAAAADVDITARELVLWVCGRSGQLGGDRPVDRLDEVDAVRRAFINHFDAPW